MTFAMNFKSLILKFSFNAIDYFGIRNFDFENSIQPTNFVIETLFIYYVSLSLFLCGLSTLESICKPHSMRPRPGWFNLLKNTVLRLIVCTGVATFTYSGYIIPIVLGRIRVDFPYTPMIDVVLLSVVCLASLTAFVGWLFLLTVQFEFVNAEDKINCDIFVVGNIAPAFLSIMSSLVSGPIESGQLWDIVGQCYISLTALLHGLLLIAMALYCLALVWLDNQAQSPGGIVDGQPMAVVVIAGKSTSGGTHGTRAAQGSAATPGSTAASSAT